MENYFSFYYDFAKHILFTRFHLFSDYSHYDIHNRVYFRLPEINLLNTKMFTTALRNNVIVKYYTVSLL